MIRLKEGKVFIEFPMLLNLKIVRTYVDKPRIGIRIGWGQKKLWAGILWVKVNTPKTRHWRII